MKRFLRPRNLIVAAVVLVVAVLVARGCASTGDADKPPYETAEATLGNLRSTVSATGTLGAVGTVDVGTQVSGTVDRVLVDFNDTVQKGQLLAVIDTELLDAAVRDAQSGVARATAGVRQSESGVASAQAGVAQAEAQLAQSRAQQTEAQAALARNQPLVAQGYLSAREFVPLQTAAASAAGGVRAAQSAVESARSTVASAQAAVAQARAGVVSAQEGFRQARKNRQNAEIRAPIAGVVIQRSIDAGQTVAASFSTPNLFVIAENLDEMEILAQVDESDVGRIEPGQQVEFTVSAYPDRTFKGVARERRLKPETVQNVVLYTVVVAAQNDDGLLLPGMTATVDFVVGGVENALLIPASALRFEPPEDVRTAARAAQRDSTAADSTAAPSGATPRFSGDLAEVWTPVGGPDKTALRPVLVRVLATDGTQTAIAPRDASQAGVVTRGFTVVTRTNETEGSGIRVGGG